MEYSDMPIVLESFAEGRWVPPTGGIAEIPSAIDGHVVATASSAGLDFGAMARHARKIGGPALRRLTFHERADMLKRLAAYLTERKQALYELAFDTGATQKEFRQQAGSLRYRAPLTATLSPRRRAPG